jgi:PKD repeat protein
MRIFRPSEAILRFPAFAAAVAVVFAAGLVGLIGGARPVFAQALTVSAGGPYTGTAGTPITMVASAPGSVSPQFTWIFGDGASGTGQVVTHAYTTATTYTVTLYVTDASNGHSGTATTTATVSGGTTGSPTVSPGGPYTGTAGAAITMVATASGAVSPQYTWQFGDGSSGNGQVVTHAYTAATTYTVVVYVTDPGTGRSGTATTTATVTGGSTGALTVSAGGPYSGTAGTAMTVSGSATGAVAPQYAWSFGDGATGSGQATSHVYSIAGTFTISLTVTDSYSAKSGTATTTVTIGGSASTCTTSVYCGLYSSNCGTGVLCGSYGSYGGTNPYSGYSSYGSSGYPNYATTAATTPSAPSPAATAASTPAGTTSAAVAAAQAANAAAGLPTFIPPLSASNSPQTTASSIPPAGAATMSSGGSPTNQSTANQGTPVSYAAGWNLIAGVQGLGGASVLSGPFSYSPSSNTYSAIAAGQALQGSSGYWVDLSAPATVYLAATGTQPMTADLPAGQYTLIGNPTGVAMTVTGADTVEVYNTSSGAYQQTTTLAPGQGAWAFSVNGATSSLSPATATLSAGGS